MLIRRKQSKIQKDRALGTLSYISPEIILEEDNVDEGASDYWALGIVIYLVYTKTRPFDDGDILDNIVNNNVDWDRLRKTNLQPKLVDLVKQLMKPDPKERYCSLKKIKAHPYFEGIKKFINLL